MRYTTAGESHGRALITIVEGVPAGVPVDPSAIDRDLARRQGGYGRGGRQSIETDSAQILSGVRFGKTIGSPVALLVANRDWDNWLDVMATTGDRPAGIRETTPRPGHADLAGILKTGSDDARDVLERASARETAARVAAGGIAKALLAALGIEIGSYVESIGTVNMAAREAGDVDREAVETSRVRCPDEAATIAMIDEIDKARGEGESLGGVFTLTATGLVPGVGSYSEASRRLDGRIAQAIMSIPAIKGVEIGEGFTSASKRGSAVHDEIVASGAGFARATNRAGGIEGGMTNGELLVVRAAMKPIPTLMSPLKTVDIDTREVADASKERSDVCAVPAAAVVAEAELAFVLADAYLEMFGCSNVADLVGAVDSYRERISR